MTVTRDYLFVGIGGNRMAQLQSDRFKLAPIRAAVCKRFGVTEAELDGIGRSGNLVDARHAAIFIARKMTGLSYPRIGRVFGNRDHSTVSYACDKMAWSCAHDEAIDAVMRELAQEVREAA